MRVVPKSGGQLHTPGYICHGAAAWVVCNELDPVPGHIGNGLVSLATRQRLGKFMHVRQEVGGIVISGDNHKVSGFGKGDGDNSDVLGVVVLGKQQVDCVE